MSISQSKSADGLPLPSKYQCGKCGGVIKPGYRMVWCKCGESAVDYGADYGRSGWLRFVGCVKEMETVAHEPAADERGEQG